MIVLLACTATACSRIPTADEANAALTELRQYGAWAWALGIGLIWVDVFLPVPQTSILAALGVIYGTWIGGVVGSIGLVTGGLIGYALMLASARQLAQRLVGVRSLQKVEGLFERNGAWAIVITRSLPYSVPEAMVFLAGLARMPLPIFVAALVVGGVPTAFAFAAIGHAWADQPLLALGVGYVLPIFLLPLALFVLRRRSR
ncbi:MAG TPA: VTT domain-containing protein [Vicinamibacterales bacterium]|nr:VTT domain-containing protein [Vicinamibacterales bacterium]